MSGKAARVAVNIGAVSVQDSSPRTVRLATRAFERSLRDSLRTRNSVRGANGGLR